MTASFDPQIYTLTVSASPPDGGSVSGGDTYSSGTPVTVTATPNSGWEMLLHFGGTVLQDKILFGTDWPLMPISMKELADEARALPLRPGVLEKWMGGNAARLLGLDS